MTLAIKIDAGNNTSGNPRRGWMLYDRDGYYLGFIDEGYAGREGIRNIRALTEGEVTIPTTPAFYRSQLKKQRDWLP